VCDVHVQEQTVHKKTVQAQAEQVMDEEWQAVLEAQRHMDKEEEEKRIVERESKKEEERKARKGGNQL
jgi:hypothetical protein